jgi:2-(1,2-epoxy-1,2-dihydrophenyl)acetyl-CoA isomerase
MAAIQFEIRNNIAFIILNRPEKYNAFNREMVVSLQNALDECKNNDQVRAVYLTGAGKAFSAGQDLAEVTDPNGRGMDGLLREQYNPIVMKIRQLHLPVVAAVNGVAAGAGANIALSCDIVVASQSAAFIQAFNKIGLIPDSGGTYFLPRLIGMQKSSALMMLGDKIMAEEAERLGMIYKVFSDATFRLEAEQIAGVLAQMPTKSIGYTKQALNRSLENTLEQQLRAEEVLQQKSAQSEDFKEGVAAFLAKRKPHFTGQ